MSKISVIMPAYNAERTIENSIKSVLNQTHKNIELIIVNDGSTDDTESIVNHIRSFEDRIFYIKTTNKGVSSARNIALDYAAGDYITFIDSDDYYDKNMLEVLLKYLCEYDCDLVSCSYERVSKSNVIPEPTYYKRGFYAKEKLVNEIYPSVITDKSLVYTAPLNIVTKIFKKSIIDRYNIRFNEKLNQGEDLLFSKEYILYAESFYYLPEYRLYKYSNNEYSVTNTFSKDRKRTLPVSLNSQNALCKKFSRFNLNKQLPYHRVRIALSSVGNIIRYMKGSREEIIDEIKLIVENKQIIDACKRADPSNFNFSRRLIYEFIKRKKYNHLYMITKIYKLINK